MNTPKKDPMMRLVYDHENISEFVDNYEQIMQLKYFKQDWDSPAKITDFFKYTLTEHIEFEEKVIFPAVLEHAPNQSIVKPLVEELLEEHKQMLSMLVEVLDKLVSMNFPIPKEKTHKIVDCLLPLLEKIQEHAAKEDDKLVPVIRNMSHIFEIQE